MSSETDHPRQRTVAELLAAHGDGTATGRRARRRAAENAGTGPGAASGGYPAVGANGADSAQPQGGAAYGGPIAGGGGAPGPAGGSAPLGNGSPAAAAGPPPQPNSGSFPAVGPQSSPQSGPFPTVGGLPASPNTPFPVTGAPPTSAPFPAVGGPPPSQLNSGSFPVVGGPPSLSSGPIPTVGGPPNSGSFPAVNGTQGSAGPGINGTGSPASPNSASAPGAWGEAPGANGAPAGSTGWGAGEASAANGGPARPTSWGGGAGPPLAKGGPAGSTGWGAGDGPPAANGGRGGPAAWGAGEAPAANGGPTIWGGGDVPTAAGNGAPAGERQARGGNGVTAWGANPGPAPWGPDAPGNGAGYAARSTAGDSAVQPGGGARPPNWERGPRPTAGGGPAAWGPDGGPADDAAPRQGGSATPWGPDTETDPNVRGREATDTAADPSGRNGRADGSRKRHRPSPRRAANPPEFTARNDPDSDAAFVNGGAVYNDPYRSRPEPADDASGAEATHRIGRRMSSPEGRERPRTGQARRRADRTTMLDPGMTGPIATQLPADDGGPSTAVGLAPAGAETWHRDRTGRRGGWDGGPPTEASAPFRLDDDEDDGPDSDRDYDDNNANDEYGDYDDRPAETDRVGYFDRPNDDPDDHPAGLPAESQRRVRSGAPSAGQAWAAVVAQWIAGAIGGAALWVGFRFLWRDLPVVALAAAVLVTVGLVLVVRALMHNDDRRTTLFAVLVGLLLTVSPAILVLLGR